MIRDNNQVRIKAISKPHILVVPDAVPILTGTVDPTVQAALDQIFTPSFASLVIEAYTEAPAP